MAGELLVAAVGFRSPDQPLNMVSLHWERGVLATVPPRKFPELY